MTPELTKGLYDLEALALGLSDPLSGVNIRQLNQQAYIVAHFLRKYAKARREVLSGSATCHLDHIEELTQTLLSRTGSLGQCRMLSLDAFQQGLMANIEALRQCCLTQNGDFPNFVIKYPVEVGTADTSPRMLLGLFTGGRQTLWSELDLLAEFGEWRLVVDESDPTSESSNGQIQFYTGVTIAFLESRFSNWKWRLASVSNFVEHYGHGPLTQAQLGRKLAAQRDQLEDARKSALEKSSFPEGFHCFWRLVPIYGRTSVLLLDHDQSIVSINECASTKAPEIIYRFYSGDDCFVVPGYWVCAAFEQADIPESAKVKFLIGGQLVDESTHYRESAHYIEIEAFGDRFCLGVDAYEIVIGEPLITHVQLPNRLNLWMVESVPLVELQTIDALPNGRIEPLLPDFEEQDEGLLFEHLNTGFDKTILWVDDGLLFDVMRPEQHDWVSAHEIRYQTVAVPVVVVCEGGGIEIVKRSDDDRHVCLVVIVGRGEALLGIKVTRPLELIKHDLIQQKMAAEHGILVRLNSRRLNEIWKQLSD